MRRKGRQTEQQTSIRKFLDRTKHSIKRLKALKFALGELGQLCISIHE